MSSISALRRACRLVPFALCLMLATRASAGEPKGKKLNDKVREIAGTAEFLRSVPKHFATLKGVDAAKRQVTLLIEGEVLPKVWSLVPDAEVKVLGWWGRLDQFGHLGDRVWVWFKTDRKKNAVAISMLADEISEQDIHGDGLTVEDFTVPLKAEKGGPPGQVKLKPAKGQGRVLKLLAPGHRLPEKVYVQSAGDRVRLLLSPEEFTKRREAQKATLRKRWADEGLPGTVSFLHVFSGEMDLIVDHEAMRWARSLKPGDAVQLLPAPPPPRPWSGSPFEGPRPPAPRLDERVKALVKHVQPWRERTQLRLVVNSFDQADWEVGQRLHLLRPAPPDEIDTATFPPDIDLPRSKQERIEWFLASIYCTCAVKGDRCTGHFYTLASCNPNGCGMPNAMRRALAERIERGLSDRQIFEELLKEHGPLLLRPHLLP